MTNEPRPKTIAEQAQLMGQAIRKVRKRAGPDGEELSQTAAAAAMGVTRGAWSNYENGRVIILRSDIQERIAAALGVDRETLLLERARLEAQAPRPGPRPATGFGDRYAADWEDPEQRRAIFPTSDGQVVLLYPADITPQGLAELEDYLTVFMKTARRERST